MSVGDDGNLDSQFAASLPVVQEIHAPLYDNLLIAANVIHAAAGAEVRKLMFLGSSCFYPREAAQPIRESTLLTGPFEPTNECYAVAKVAGVKLCQAYRRQYAKDFIAVVPTNLYGPGDNFDLATGHVIPALIRRLHEAAKAGHKPVDLWGTGRRPGIINCQRGRIQG